LPGPNGNSHISENTNTCLRSSDQVGPGRVKVMDEVILGRCSG
jgi:hypothetical protein